MIGDRWRTAGVAGVLLVVVYAAAAALAGEPGLPNGALPPAAYVVLPPTSIEPSEVCPYGGVAGG